MVNVVDESVNIIPAIVHVAENIAVSTRTPIADPSAVRVFRYGINGGGKTSVWGGGMVVHLPNDFEFHGWRSSGDVADAGGSGCRRALQPETGTPV